MKVLLINPRLPGHRKPFYVPIGLGYVASMLRAYDHEVQVYDIGAYQYTDEQVEEFIKTIETKLICIGALVPQFKYVKWLSSIIKKHHPKSTIVIGGGLTNVFRGTPIAASEADIAVYGEADFTILDIIKAVENKLPLSEVKGICYKDNQNNIITNPPREAIRNLDDIPSPAYDLLAMDIYVKGECWGAGPLRNTNIVTARGCPYVCTFCPSSLGRKLVISRSPDNVIKELLFLQKTYGIEYFYFGDETFTYNRKWIKEFCDKLKATSSGIKFGFQSRVDLVDSDIFTMLKDAGCITVQYGCESGSNKVLKIVDKRFTVEQAEKSLNLTKEFGFNTMASLLIGVPGETKEDIRETIEFAKRNAGIPFFYSFVTPFPNTPLWPQVVKEGRLKYNEEELLNRYGEFGYDIAANVSDFTDEELTSMKRQAEDEIARENERQGYYFVHQYLTNERSKAKLLRNYYWKYGAARTIDYVVPVRKAISYVKREGVANTVKRILQNNATWMFTTNKAAGRLRDTKTGSSEQNTLLSQRSEFAD